jgi:hypothetical protein
MKRLSILFCLPLLLNFGSVSAKTIVGGYISYTYLNSSKYEIKFHILQDCFFKNTLAPDVKMELGLNGGQLGGVFSLTPKLISSIPFYPNCNTTNCDSVGGPNETFQLLVYADTVDFAMAPYAAVVAQGGVNGASFVMSQWGRSSNLNTGMAGSKFGIRSWLRLKDINGNSLTNTSVQIDAIGDMALFGLCNQLYMWAPNISSKTNGDSISFELSAAENGSNGNAVQYSTPWSAQLPMSSFCIPPTTIACNPTLKSNPPRGFYFDKSIGLVVFVPVQCNERGVIVEKIREWRKIAGNWTEMGYVNFEFSVFIEDGGLNDFNPPLEENTIDSVAVGINYIDKIDTKKIEPGIYQSQIFRNSSIALLQSPNSMAYVPKPNLGSGANGHVNWMPTSSQLGLVKAVFSYEMQICPRIYKSSFVKTYHVYEGNNILKLRAFNDKNGNGLQDNGEGFLKEIEFSYGANYSQGVVMTNDTGLALIMAKSKEQLKVALSPGQGYFLTNRMSVLQFYFKDTTKTILVPLQSQGIINGRLFNDIDSSCNLTSGSENLNEYSTVVLGDRVTSTNAQGQWHILLDSSINSSLRFANSFIPTCTINNYLVPSSYHTDSVYNLSEMALNGKSDLGLELRKSHIGDTTVVEILVRNYAKLDLDSWNPGKKVFFKLPFGFNSSSNSLDYDSINQIYSFVLPNIKANSQYLFQMRLKVISSPSTHWYNYKRLALKCRFDVDFDDAIVENNSAELIVFPNLPRMSQSLELWSSAESYRRTDQIYHCNIKNDELDTVRHVKLIGPASEFDIESFVLINTSDDVLINHTRDKFSFEFLNIQLAPGDSISFDWKIKSKALMSSNYKQTLSLLMDRYSPIPLNNWVGVNNVDFATVTMITPQNPCERGVINVAYNFYGMQTDGKLLAQIWQGNTKVADINQIWHHDDLLKDTGSISFVLPPWLQDSTSYSVRLYSPSDTQYASNPGGVFRLKDQKVLAVLSSKNYCNGEDVILNLKNADNYKIKLNGLLVKTSSGGQVNLGRLKKGDSIEVLSENPNGCNNYTQLKPDILPKKIPGSMAQSTYCNGDLLTVNLSGFQKFNVYFYNTKVQAGVGPGLSNARKASGTAASVSIFGYSDTSLCKDSINYLIAIDTLPKINASYLKNPVCYDDLVQIELRGNDIYTIFRNQESLLGNLSRGIYALGKDSLNDFSVGAVNAKGCKANTKLGALLVNDKINPSIIGNGDMLSTQTYAKYKWFNYNGTPNSGVDTLKEYLAPTTGHYFVVVEDENGCKGQSETYYAVKLAMNEPTFNQPKVYPNPFGQEIIVANTAGLTKSIIYDMAGRIVVLIQGEFNHIPTQELAKGQYVLELYGPWGKFSQLVHKL